MFVISESLHSITVDYQHSAKVNTLIMQQSSKVTIKINIKSFSLYTFPRKSLVLPVLHKILKSCTIAVIYFTLLHTNEVAL